MFNIIVLKGNVTDETASTKICTTVSEDTHKLSAKIQITSSLKTIQIQLNRMSLPLRMCQSMHHFILVFGA